MSLMVVAVVFMALGVSWSGSTTSCSTGSLPTTGLARRRPTESRSPGSLALAARPAGQLRRRAPACGQPVFNNTEDDDVPDAPRSHPGRLAPTACRKAIRHAGLPAQPLPHPPDAVVRRSSKSTTPRRHDRSLRHRPGILAQPAVRFHEGLKYARRSLRISAGRRAEAAPWTERR